MCIVYDPKVESDGLKKNAKWELYYFLFSCDVRILKEECEIGGGCSTVEKYE
jgi:hypothetical protein